MDLSIVKLTVGGMSVTVICNRLDELSWALSEASTSIVGEKAEV